MVIHKKTDNLMPNYLKHRQPQLYGSIKEAQINLKEVHTCCRQNYFEKHFQF